MLGWSRYSCGIACCKMVSLSFFFNDTATTEIYTLSLHDALPIFPSGHPVVFDGSRHARRRCTGAPPDRERPRQRSTRPTGRSEEHTPELQSRQYLVCRLLLEKNKH